MLKSETADITAQNTFTGNFKANNSFNLIIAGTWVATVTLYILRADGSTWVAITTFTSNAVKLVTAPPNGGTYRVGVATGDFTSGTVNLELNQ